MRSSLAIALPDRVKTIDFIRHGEGFHNVAGEADPALYRSWQFEDAHLTDRGWEQARRLGAALRASPDHHLPDVIIVSPLTRALETAAGVYGVLPWDDGTPGPPLMMPQPESQAVAEARGVAAAGVPHMLASEHCREHLGLHPCDRRRPKGVVARRFPSVDFSLVPEGEDMLWDGCERESEAALSRRGRELVEFLAARKERHLAVVAHGGILREALKHFGSHTPNGEGSEVQLHARFENCEIRSVVMVVGPLATLHPP